jgi:hypothetical protein
MMGKRGVRTNFGMLQFAIFFVISFVIILLNANLILAESSGQYISSSSFPILTLQFDEAIDLSTVQATVQCKTSTGLCYQSYNTMLPFASVGPEMITVSSANADNSAVRYGIQVPLLSDDYIFKTVVKDLLDNEASIELDLKVQAEFMDINLLEPANGWSSTDSFDLVIETQYPATCWYNPNQFVFQMPSPPPTYEFDETTGTTIHRVVGLGPNLDSSFTIQSPREFYIVCKTVDDNKLHLGNFTVAWDNTNPVIAYSPESEYLVNDIAQPYIDITAQSRRVGVDPEDAIGCKVTNLTEDGEVVIKDPIPFEDVDLDDPWNFTSRTHRKINFNHLLLDPAKLYEPHDYKFEVACENSAGLLPEPATQIFDVLVHFARHFSIERILPNSYVSDSSVPIKVKTSVTTDSCELIEDGELEGNLMTRNQSDGKSYFAYVAGLSEGEYTYHVQCEATYYLANGSEEITFVVDRTAPTNLQINTDSHSCSLDELKFDISAEDDNGLVEFTYNVSGANVSFAGTKSASGSSDSVSVSKSSLELVNAESYVIKAWAKDVAGNVYGPATMSVQANPSTEPMCDKSSPNIDFEILNESITQVLVNVTCSDSGTGCAQTYSLERLSDLNSSCTFNGVSTDYAYPIIVEYDTTLCVQAYDLAGNSVNKSQIIRMPQEQPNHCENGIKDADEVSLDCGGSCSPCGFGQGCNEDSDCDSGLWCPSSSKKCDWTSCDDGFMNGDESDVDCGGSCPNCAVGLKCSDDSDCEGNFCNPDTFLCQLPTCFDGFLNGFESDVDCGGFECDPCPSGFECLENSDCLTNYCDSDYTCSDSAEPSNPVEPVSSIKLIPLILLVLGILLILGGAGYVYYYRFYVKPNQKQNPIMTEVSSRSSSEAPKDKGLSKEQIAALNRRRTLMKQKFDSRNDANKLKIEKQLSTFEEKTAEIKTKKSMDSQKKASDIFKSIVKMNDSKKTSEKEWVPEHRIQPKLKDMKLDYGLKGDYIHLSKLNDNAVDVMKKDPDFKKKVMVDVFAQLDKIHKDNSNAKLKSKKKSKYYEGVVPIQASQNKSKVVKDSVVKDSKSKSSSEFSSKSKSINDFDKLNELGKVNTRIVKDNDVSDPKKLSNSLLSKAKQNNALFDQLESINSLNSSAKVKPGLEKLDSKIKKQSNEFVNTESMVDLFKKNELSADVFKVILAELLNSKKLNKQDVSGIIFRLLEDELISDSKAHKILADLNLVNDA